MSIEALKEQARKNEQNEDWGAALQVYVEAINRQSDDDQPDLGLYNRAGDISTRLGDAVGAIQYYEQAVDLYLEAELPNNAIAILKKILRNLPDRAEVFLRMGQIRARQGFLTDARNNFLAYAEKKQQQGDMDEAFRALEEFANVAPGDVEVRIALADQLHAHERSGEAMLQLARVYHEHNARGEGEAAQGIEQRIREIDADFVIPNASDLGAAVAFETNTLAVEEELSEGFDADAGLDGSFDEIALGEPEEIAFPETEEIEFGDPEATTDDAEGVAFDEPEELAFAGAEELALEGTEGEIGAVATEESEVFGSELGDEAADFDDEGDEAISFGSDAEEALDFATAVYGGEEDEVSDDATMVAAQSEELESTDDQLADQDDWEVGADIEDAFIAFDDPESAGASVTTDDTASDDTVPNDLDEDVAFEEDVALEAEEASAEAEVVLEAEGDVAFADEMDGLPLIGFDGEEESFDSESAVTEVETEAEPTTAVALEGDFDEEQEVAELSWSGVEVDAPAEEDAVTASDDLWSEVPASETENDDDEWIGVAAEADADVEPDDAGIAAEAEMDEAIAVEEGPALIDFESYSVSDLREYVASQDATGGAWERLGRLTLEEGDTSASQEAFEEAHLAYSQSQDYMSAMRCVRELLLGEPDQIEYHQRLVEYAHRADDRTLQVSAYLELADCLARTGAPAKARAVHKKVLEIDPTNRRAAAAVGDDEAERTTEADDPDAGYVDLGSMVIERSEKTTRWTVEADEPVREEDFDFQNMLAQFKAKVAENVDIDDVKAHYDLGTAYKEMGLVDEAITEFQAALRADGQNLATFEMLGQCFMDKGQPEMAVRSLTRATEMPFDVEDELLGIYYYLGRAHEELGNAPEAVEYYEKIFALDINFEDVTERLRALR